MVLIRLILNNNFIRNYLAMTNYRVLAQSKQGYILKCSDCTSYQLGFGTTILSFTEDEFKTYNTIVFKEINDRAFSNTPTQKCIVTPTFSPGIKMVLSYNEFKNLKQLLAEASLIAEVTSALRYN